MVPKEVEPRCSCASPYFTNDTIYLLSADGYSNGVTFTYNSNDFDYTGGTNVSNGITDAYYPSFAIVADTNDVLFLAFCYRNNGAFYYVDADGYAAYNAGTPASGSSCNSFVNTNYTGCCNCCCGDVPGDFITDGTGSVGISIISNCTIRDTTEPGGD